MTPSEPATIRRQIPVIVNLSHLKAAGIEDALHAAVKPGALPADEMIDVDQAAADQAMLNDALVEMDKAETRPDVMSAPENAFASFLQAQLAARAASSRTR